MFGSLAGNAYSYLLILHFLLNTFFPLTADFLICIYLDSYFLFISLWTKLCQPIPTTTTMTMPSTIITTNITKKSFVQNDNITTKMDIKDDIQSTTKKPTTKTSKVSLTSTKNFVTRTFSKQALTMNETINVLYSDTR